MNENKTQGGQVEISNASDYPVAPSSLGLAIFQLEKLDPEAGLLYARLLRDAGYRTKMVAAPATGAFGCNRPTLDRLLKLLAEKGAIIILNKGRGQTRQVRVRPPDRWKPGQAPPDDEQKSLTGSPALRTLRKVKKKRKLKEPHQRDEPHLGAKRPFLQRWQDKTDVESWTYVDLLGYYGWHFAEHAGSEAAELQVKEPEARKMANQVKQFMVSRYGKEGSKQQVKEYMHWLFETYLKSAESEWLSRTPNFSSIFKKGNNPFFSAYTDRENVHRSRRRQGSRTGVEIARRFLQADEAYFEGDVDE